jgi:SAM-dependent methyltransferase
MASWAILVIIGSVHTKHASSVWDQVAEKAEPSWYLDPLVAKQKREVHQALVRKWLPSVACPTILKTDLFEEAFGDDHLLCDLAAAARQVIGIDIAERTVSQAKSNATFRRSAFAVGDVRQLPFKTASFDFVFSNSTLDHFDHPADLKCSVGELVRIMRPGGLLLITLDNPLNPLYHLLRAVTRGGLSPFKLGCTLSKSGLNDSLRDRGMEVLGNDWLIHNPRLVSTAMFKVLRAVLRSRADVPISTLLKWFSALERLPSRHLTACFVAACARKPQ